MKNIIPIFLLLSLAISLLGLSSNNTPTEKKVIWYSWEEAVKENAKSPKPFFIDIYTDWCGWCKKMDATTFEDDKVAAYLNKNFYPVKLNAEQKEDIVWKGHPFKFVDQGRRGYHELAAALTEGQLSYPNFVLLNEKYERIMISPGYKDVNALMPQLTFASEGHYSKTTWEAYNKTLAKEKPTKKLKKVLPKKKVPTIQKQKLDKSKIIKKEN